MKEEIRLIEFTKLEQKVVDELDREDVPDFKLLCSEEILVILPSVLDKLLEIEKNKFYKLLEIKDENISFNIFEDDDRLTLLFGLIEHFESVNSNDITRNIINDFQPKYIEFVNEMTFSKRFYDIHVICRNKWWLYSDQKRILDLAIRSFERNGINLPIEKQNRLKEISQLMAKLSFDFSNNVLDSEKEFEYILKDDEFIKDLPKDVLENAQELAKKNWIEWYKFLSDDSAYINIMKYCSNSDIRKFFSDFRNRVASKGKFDNRPIILKLLQLRQEMANILWFANYAELSLDEKMATNPKEVIKQEDIITEKANIKAKKELQELKDYFKIKEIHKWDTIYYSRIIKEQKYEINDKKLREYFEYNRVILWLFDIVKKLYDVDFREINISQNNNIKTYEVYRWWVLKAYYIMDMFYRQGKSSWAWSHTVRNINTFQWKTKLPIVINVGNFQKSKDVTLLNYSDVSTIFHEFWHALHSILCEVKYWQLCWPYAEWDFIELPSQLMENWCKWEWLKTFAYNYKTGENISQELIDKLYKLKTFFNWMNVIQRNAYSKLDMILHTQKVPASIEELDKTVLDIMNSIFIFKFSENDKVHASFAHIFAWAYAAWFYSYLWAEIIEADIFAEFKKNWIFNKTTADRFLRTILSQWTRKPALELFRDFMWRDVSLDAFFERNWF